MKMQMNWLRPYVSSFVETDSSAGAVDASIMRMKNVIALSRPFSFYSFFSQFILSFIIFPTFILFIPISTLFNR